jgi:hypothetical protein
VRDPVPFPQLAFFVAGAPALSLYRQFIFPQVSARTKLLALGLDEIDVKNPENTQMAIDIALSAAAVVIYDSGSRPPLQEDYVRARRPGRPMIRTTSPSNSQGSQESNENLNTIDRPEEMSGWSQSFVDLLLNHIASEAPPQPELMEIQTKLSRLRESGSYRELLLTGLALVERKMREEDLQSTVLPTVPTEGVLERLERHFGVAFPSVREAVSLRHNLLHGIKPPAEDLERVSNAVFDLATHASPIRG